MFNQFFKNKWLIKLNYLENKVKILILSSYFGNVLGGALNFITELYIELESRNHKVTLLLDERYKDLFSDKKFNIISKVLNTCG